MADANQLLFEHTFNGQPLFKNQLDLVQNLLTTSAYSLIEDAPEMRAKATNRLKAYVSQLLSGSANRTITVDFRISLKELLDRKIADKSECEEVANQIIEDMRNKSERSVSKPLRLPHTNSFYKDFSESKYVSVITANVVNPIINNDGKAETITEVFIKDLFESIIISEIHSKKYRFNFPIRSDCNVFWRFFEKGIKELLYSMVDLKIFNDRKIIEKDLYEPFLIKTATIDLYQKYQELKSDANGDKENVKYLKSEVVSNIAKDMVELLNRNKTVLTFHVEEPIYSMPLVILDPQTFGTTKMYALIENENKEINILKCSEENMLLWRRFVWNHILVSKLSTNIPCPYLI